MDCPSCKQVALAPAKLAPGLPCYTCPSCMGSLVDILTYRMWVESNTLSSTEPSLIPTKIDDTKGTTLCPKCSHIMAKYHITADISNKLDLCHYCGSLWLDGGEWILLEQLNLNASIPQILSTPWQQAIREEKIAQSVEQKFEQILGQEDYKKVHQFRSWLNEHLNKRIIVDYLTRPTK